MQQTPLNENSKIGRQRLLPPSPKIFCAASAVGDHLNVNMALRSLELGVQLGGGEIMGGLRLTSGGAGFLDAMDTLLKPRRYRFICPGKRNDLQLCDVLFELDSRTAIIEASQIFAPPSKDADFNQLLKHGSSGLATLIIDAMALGARHLIIGLSKALNIDAGLGLISRLADGLETGASRGKQLYAKNLLDLPYINLSRIKEKLKDVEISVYCSTLEPLISEEAPHKYENREFQTALTKWVDLLENQSSTRLKSAPGSGAGGGVGFALAALGAKLLPGAEAYLTLAQLEKQLSNCDGLVTCLNHLDQTAFKGKAPWQAITLAEKVGCQGMIACVSADPHAVAFVEAQGIKVIAHSSDLPLEQQSAEAFTRLQQAVNQFVRTGR